MNDEKKLRDRLSSEAYDVTQNASTERPFTSALLENKEAGMYTCVVCDAELFSSDTKFESGTGWSSFTEPADRQGVELRSDNKLGMRRVEVTCKSCDAHLGHVFTDGPGEGGERYCINGCALEFRGGNE